MPVRSKRWPSPQTLYEFSIRHNILVPVILLLIASGFKILDIFVLHLDELLGEIILSKSIGFLMIILYLRLVGKSVTAIGLHRDSVKRALIIGATGVAMVIAVSYGLQYGILIGVNKEPIFEILAIDPRTGMTGALPFAVFLIFGNFVNSFMEEGLFRGVMLRHFRVSLSFWKANLLQAVLFALWHLTVPGKGLITGQLDLSGAALQSVTLLAGIGMYGFAMGYLYLKTDNLWAPWLAHTINNSVLNMTHIRTIDGLDSDMMVFQVTLSVGFIVVMLWFRKLAERFQMPEVKPWNQEASKITTFT
ncbi:lysostaphin resistance A-like protein [Chloroflexota bacterium]